MLLSQVNEISPDRSKSDDGWIGDAAHAGRNSDHNPNTAGVVQAQDITHDPAGGFDSYKFAETLRQKRDNRIKYVISNHRIFAGNAGPKAWTWRSYTGSNPHDRHVHISVANDAVLYDDARAWDIEGDWHKEVPTIGHPVLRKGSTGPFVVQLQGLLPKWIDGDFGTCTEDIVKAFQRSQGLAADGIVGEQTWAALLGETPPEPTPEPPLPEPSPPNDWQYEIIATEFGGPGDEQPVAYSDVQPGWPDRPGVALPMRFSGARPDVEVRANGRSVVCQIVDVGPWYPSNRGPADPYWETGARPRAESDDRTNGAGIDLTPAAADAVGIGGKGLVDWRFA